MNHVMPGKASYEIHVTVQADGNQVPAMFLLSLDFDVVVENVDFSLFCQGKHHDEE